MNSGAKYFTEFVALLPCGCDSFDPRFRCVDTKCALNNVGFGCTYMPTCYK